MNGSIDSNCRPAMSEHNAGVFQPLWVVELQFELVQLDSFAALKKHERD